MRFSGLSAIALLSLVAMSACSANTNELAAGGDEALTGVTDLTALEAELGLVKDVQDAHGAWSRPDAKLVAGPCYQRTIGGPNGRSFEFRRYRQGAVFFAKRGTTPVTGDQRPLSCVDIDGTDYDNKPATYAVAGIALDTAMRYHLGKPAGSEGAAGHIYIDFDRGAVEIGEPEHYCGLFGDSGAHSPGPNAFAQELASCKQHGGGEDDCDARAMTACKKAVAADVAKDTIDRPVFDDIGMDAPSYFYHLQISPPNNDGSYANIPGGLASLVYRHAWKTGKTQQAFTLAEDPAGKFVKMEATYSDDGTKTVEHARFERLDGHHTIDWAVERIAITPKNSDDKIVENALVLCTRTVDGNGNATTSYQCRGL